MTPEERADKVSEELDCSFRGEWSGHIAAAIRAAENDALERAAVAMEDDERGADYIEARMYQGAAEDIRALKHKDVK